MVRFRFFIVLLPTLSRLLRDGKKEESIATQNQAIWVALFLALPSAVGIFMLSEEIIHVLFERGNFDAVDTKQVSNALLAFSLGIPAFVSAKIFTPSFYAAEDTRTPVKIAVLCIITNIVISLSLIHFFNFNHVALAIATATSSWINVGLLKASLTKKGLFHMNPETFEKIVQIGVCSLLMGLCIYGFKHLHFTDSLTLHLLATISVSGSVYILAAMLLKVISLRNILGRK
jgi:putative peptidoglycan lipid II flippase